jgi:NurA-like 5'-3' nuclease
MKKTKLFEKVIKDAKKIQDENPEKTGLQCLEEAKEKYKDEISELDKK